MTDLMKKIAKARLFQVRGMAVNREKEITHLDNGLMYAAVDGDDALKQAEKFWTEQMGFDEYTGTAKLIDRVGDYKVVLVYDGSEEEE